MKGIFNARQLLQFGNHFPHSHCLLQASHEIDEKYYDQKSNNIQTNKGVVNKRRYADIKYIQRLYPSKQ